MFSLIGKIAVQDADCEVCTNTIRLYNRSDTVICANCGAKYDLETSTMHDQHIEYEYKRDGFCCIHSSLLEKCNNSCPSQFMYCEKHCNEKSLEQAEKNIKRAEISLEDTKEALQRMKESRKIWLIQKVSGINEQDDSVREN